MSGPHGLLVIAHIQAMLQDREDEGEEHKNARLRVLARFHPVLDCCGEKEVVPEGANRM
jgi:hypothetical protein